MAERKIAKAGPEAEFTHIREGTFVRGSILVMDEFASMNGGWGGTMDKLETHFEQTRKEGFR